MLPNLGSSFVLGREKCPFCAVHKKPQRSIPFCFVLVLFPGFVKCVEKYTSYKNQCGGNGKERLHKVTDAMAPTAAAAFAIY